MYQQGILTFNQNKIVGFDYFNAKMGEFLKHNKLIIMKKQVLLFLITILFSIYVQGQQELKKITLFTNVQVFDGITDQLLKRDVLIEDNLIKQISEEPLAVIQSDNVTIIDGNGMTLMPGIIEAHGHLGLPIKPSSIGTDEDWQYVALKSSVVAKRYLDHGWTTVRDAVNGVLVKKDNQATDKFPGAPIRYPIEESGKFEPIKKEITDAMFVSK